MNYVFEFNDLLTLLHVPFDDVLTISGIAEWKWKQFDKEIIKSKWIRNILNWSKINYVYKSNNGNPPLYAGLLALFCSIDINDTEEIFNAEQLMSFEIVKQYFDLRTTHMEFLIIKKASDCLIYRTFVRSHMVNVYNCTR